MLFQTDHRQGSHDQRRLYALFEIFYTVIDFAAATLFIIGSFMFLSDDWMTPGTWCFIVGSFFFAAKPALRLVRELKLAALGDAEDLAKRFRS
ncbi:YrhK family protein [Marinibacterium sp. SX1]|uniref:YrhK family protein n=1 Tax=Marinibacterium sp. SX1 TaxID=3388424 RepID=UPI003D17EDAC